MSRALRAYDQQELPVVISRRIKSQSYGLGFWSAVGMQGAEAMREQVKQQKSINPPRSGDWNTRLCS